jgi:hypothetical protein
MTGWVMLGLEASGSNPADLRSGGETPVAYLRAQAGRLRSVGDLERTILALEGAGLDSRRFAGNDLVSTLRKRRDGDGSVDGQVNLTAFYALAIRAAGADPASLERSARWLRNAQNSDGGWGIQPEAPSEADSTGAALQGLIAAGSGGSATSKAVAWLRKAQRGGGGYALGSSGVVNSQSTAWAVQGLVAADGGAAQIDRSLAYLARLQQGDGHYRYSTSSDQTPAWVTAQVLLAVERQPFPVPAVARAAGRTGSAAEPDSGSASEPGPGAPSAGTGRASTPAGGESSSEGAVGGVNGADAGGGGSGPGGPGSAASSGDGATQPPGVTAAENGPTTAGGDPGGDPGDPPVSVRYPQADGDDGATGYLLGGLAVLGAIAIGGFVWYRRRLP